MNNSLSLFSMYTPEKTETPFQFFCHQISPSLLEIKKMEKKQMFLGFSFINEHFPSRKTAFVDLGKSHSALAYGNEINLVSW